MGCRFGMACRFLHMSGNLPMNNDMGMNPMMAPQGPVMMTPNPVYMPPTGHAAPRAVPCRFFNSRGCRNGDRCPFLHVAEASTTKAEWSNMSEAQKQEDKSRRVRQKLPGLQVLKCGVCNGDFVRRPGGDRDIREVLKEHYEKMFYARDPNHVRYLEQDMFRLEGGAEATVSCPATGCEARCGDVLALLCHLGEQADLTKHEPGRHSFQHQFHLSAIARLFAWRDTLEFLNIDEFDSDDDKARTVHDFNMELFGLLNLAGDLEGSEEAAAADQAASDEATHDASHDEDIDSQMKAAIDREIEKEMAKLVLEGGEDCDEAGDASHSFTDDEVLELAAQGITPHDPEARQALDTLRAGGGQHSY